MTPYAIGAVVALAAAAAALAVVSAAAAACWRVAHPRIARLPARARAHALAALRLVPAAAAAGLAAVVAVAFARLEPADAGEVLGATLPALALAAAGAGGCRLARAISAWRQTARAVAAWSTDGQIVESEFPIVAVVGVWRPRLVIARRVVEACDEEERAAMFAHERAHISALDNLTRLSFLATPFAVPRVGAALEQAWTRAAEEAADDAARGDERMALALASALTKVARLAAGQPLPVLQASAIFSGTGVSDRVRRLLETPPPAAGARSPWRYAATIAAMALIASAAAMRQIYELAEYCVRNLP